MKSSCPCSILNPRTDQTLPPNLPRTVTIRELFTRYLDFNAVPRRTFFQYLRYFSTDELETDKLDEFLSKEGAVSIIRNKCLYAEQSMKDELYDYCFRVKRTIKEILSDFHHVVIPMAYIFDVFPPLRPRQFSVASSVKVRVCKGNMIINCNSASETFTSATFVRRYCEIPDEIKDTPTGRMYVLHI